MQWICLYVYIYIHVFIIILAFRFITKGSMWTTPKQLSLNLQSSVVNPTISHPQLVDYVWISHILHLKSYSPKIFPPSRLRCPLLSSTPGPLTGIFGKWGLSENLRNIEESKIYNIHIYITAILHIYIHINIYITAKIGWTLVEKLGSHPMALHKMVIPKEAQRSTEVKNITLGGAPKL
jgi:hypothetical protein